MKFFDSTGKIIGWSLSAITLAGTLVGGLWAVNTWAYDLKNVISLTSDEVEKSKEDIRTQQQLLDSLVNLHEKQQTEKDLIVQLCKTGQAKKEYCTFHGLEFGENEE